MLKLTRFGLDLPIGNDIVKVAMLGDMILIVAQGLVQSPAFHALQTNFVRQFLQNVLCSVAGMHVQSFCTTIQKEKSEEERELNLVILQYKCQNNLVLHTCKQWFPIVSWL